MIYEDVKGHWEHVYKMTDKRLIQTRTVIPDQKADFSHQHRCVPHLFRDKGLNSVRNEKC